MTFKELNITEPILKAIEEKGYAVPTPIQGEAIPAALAKSEILGCAQKRFGAAGTGKTVNPEYRETRFGRQCLCYGQIRPRAKAQGNGCKRTEFHEISTADTTITQGLFSSFEMSHKYLEKNMVAGWLMDNRHS